jgi:acyl-CoA thioesterase FadM
MNLWLRMFWVLLTARFRGRFQSPLDVSLIALRVLPNDLDVNFHVNNGRYLTLMDLGRLDLFIRGGLWRILRQTGWMPVLSAGSISFRRELKLFQKFRMETAIVYWTETTFVMRHRCLIVDPRRGETIAATALIRGGIYDRKARSFVPVAHLFDLLGIETLSPPLSEDVRVFLEAADVLRRIK